MVGTTSTGDTTNINYGSTSYFSSFTQKNQPLQSVEGSKISKIDAALVNKDGESNTDFSNLPISPTLSTYGNDSSMYSIVKEIRNEIVNFKLKLSETDFNNSSGIVNTTSTVINHNSLAQLQPVPDRGAEEFKGKSGDKSGDKSLKKELTSNSNDTKLIKTYGKNTAKTLTDIYNVFNKFIKYIKDRNDTVDRNDHKDVKTTDTSQNNVVSMKDFDNTSTDISTDTSTPTNQNSSDSDSVLNLDIAKNIRTQYLN